MDHIDGNGLNNRRGNLRVCTPAQNRANSRPCGGVSGLVGVYPKGNKWRASIVHRGRFYYLGLFDDRVAAAKARDRKADELCGPYAYRNFPQDFKAIRPKRGRKKAPYWLRKDMAIYFLGDLH